MSEKETKLKVRWSKKEKDIEVIWQNTQRANANYLFSRVFNNEFEAEMKKRGFDITTIKFEIKGLEARNE